MKRSNILFTFVVVLLFGGNSFANDDLFKKQMNGRLSSIETADKTLENLVIQAPPKQSNKSELEAWRKQTQWFSLLRKRYSDYKADLILVKQGVTLEAHMAQMNMQFLALQEATQMESRKLQTLSNASKARHDIALNSIRNMK